MELKSVSTPLDKGLVILVTDKNTDIKKIGISKTEIAEVQQQQNSETHFTFLGNKIVVYIDDKPKNDFYRAEKCRLLGAELTELLNKHYKTESVTIGNYAGFKPAGYHFLEGMALANYQFTKYKKDPKKEKFALRTIAVLDSAASQKQIEELSSIVEAVHIARDLVNEPPNVLTAEQLALEAEKLAKKAKINIKILNKSEIKKEKMGGLLAVNLGSQTPPTFTIMEYKPKNAINKHPIVLVGKGVVFDTGGLSLKPTPQSMDYMKCDMGGAAAVICATYIAALNKLPLHIITLVPATDNRPGEDAYTPSDVITMHNNTTVEVLNTDAEGRMILADALSYAQRYNPQLVLDVATLTGAALFVLGSQGSLVMGNAGQDVINTLIKSGYETHERLIELPLWEEFKDYVKSDMGDIKNTGKGKEAGSIVGGVFLQNFVNYPWLHLDIATVAYTHEKHGYWNKNSGTGYGVRLIYQFLKNIAEIK